MPNSPTQRSLKKIRTEGAIVSAIVERFIHAINMRQDLFGCIDILAIKPGGKTLAVQTTSGQCIPDHLRKMLGKEKAMKAMLDAGWEIELHGWRKINRSRTDKRKVYKCRVIKFNIGDSGELNHYELKE